MQFIKQLAQQTPPNAQNQQKYPNFINEPIKESSRQNNLTVASPHLEPIMFSTNRNKYLPYILAVFSASLLPFAELYLKYSYVHIEEALILQGFSFIFFNYAITRLPGANLLMQNRDKTQDNNHNKQKKPYRYLILRCLLTTAAHITISLIKFYYANIIAQNVLDSMLYSSFLFVFFIDWIVPKVNHRSIGQQSYSYHLLWVLIAFIGAILVINFGKTVQSNNISLYIRHLNHGDTQKPRQALTNCMAKNVGLPYIHAQNSLQNKAMIVFLIMISIIAKSYSIVLTRNLSYNTYQINLVYGLFLQLSVGLVYQLQLKSCLIFPIQETLFPTLYRVFTIILFSGLPIAICEVIWVSSIKITLNASLVSMCGLTSIITYYIITIFINGLYSSTDASYFASILGLFMIAISIYKSILIQN